MPVVPNVKDACAKSRISFPTIGLVIVAVAFALRVWRLGAQSFWWDEAYSTMVASRGLRDIVATLAREDYHPPLHYFLLHYWLHLVGQTEFALRYLSVGAGVITVAAAWSASRRLFGPRAAPIAAVLFATSPFLWYYSQETRMFALVPLFGTMAVYFCARAADDQRAVSWAGYTLTVALGLWDFYYAVFLPFACGLWIILGPRKRDQFLRWLIATAVAFALYLPWIPIFLSRSEAWSSAFIPDNGPIKIVTWSWPAFVLGLPSLELYHEPLAAVLLGAFAIATLIAIVWSWRERRLSGALLAALTFVVPLALMAAISIIKPVFHPRYAIPALPGLLLLLAGLLAYLLRESVDGLPRITGSRAPGKVNFRAVTRGAAVVLGGLLLACAGFGLYRLQTDPAFARDDYRSAIAYVHAGEKPGDVIIHNAIPPFWYYDHGPAPASYFPSRPYSEANVIAELNDVTRGKSRLWYVDNDSIPNDPDGFVDNQLRLHATRLDERYYGFLRVQLWQIPRDNAFVQSTFITTSSNLANELTLTGYAVAGEPVGGSTLDVEVQVTAQRKPLADDGFWVALSDSAGRLWGRADDRPHDSAFRLSSGWTPNESLIIRFDLPIDVGTPPGAYHLVAGAYRLSDLAGLNVLDAAQHPLGQSVALGSVNVAKVTMGGGDSALPDQHSQTVLPGLTLAAADPGPTTLAPGDHLPVTLLWQVSTAVADETTSLRLQSANGQVIAKDDGPLGGAFPASKWPIGATIREQRQLNVPASAPGGPVNLILLLANGKSVPIGSATINQVTRDFQAPTPTHALDARFGDRVGLVGYDLAGDPAQPGGKLTLTLDWRAIQASTISYHVFVHVLDAQDHIWAQWDGVPRDWTYPVSAWLPGEYVVDHYALQLSPQTPIGQLTVETGMYDAASGQRLTVVAKPGAATTDSLVLQPVQVVAR